MELRWSEFLNISSLQYNDDRVYKGVYIWGFTIDKKFIPYYVGEAFDVEYRLTDHVHSILSGRYCIHHKNTLNKFYKNKNAEITGNDGLLYYPNWPYGYNEFLKLRESLMPHINFMVSTMTYTYAILSDPKILKKELKEVEKICINKIEKKRLWNVKSGDNSNLELIHTGNKTIVRLLSL